MLFLVCSSQRSHSHPAPRPKNKTTMCDSRPKVTTKKSKQRRTISGLHEGVFFHSFCSPGASIPPPPAGILKMGCSFSGRALDTQIITGEYRLGKILLTLWSIQDSVLCRNDHGGKPVHRWQLISHDVHNKCAPCTSRPPPLPRSSHPRVWREHLKF